MDAAIRAFPQGQPMAIKISDQAVAVDTAYFWRPLQDCPRGVKVQLRGQGGVATYGHYDGKDPFWTDWAPLPKLRSTTNN